MGGINNLSFIKDDDYSVEQQVDVLTKLKSLVATQLEYEKRVAEAEEQLESLKKILNRVSMDEIPNLLKQHGLSRIKLDTGEVVEIKEDINVTIVDKGRFFEFLHERDEEDIIKTQIALDRVDSTKLNELYSFLMDNDYPYNAEVNVHSQTLKAYFKEICGMKVTEDEREKGYATGRYTPPSALPDFCKVFTLSRAKIK